MKVHQGFLALVATLLLAGCGGNSKIDEDKPIDQVSAEAAKMGKEDLQKVVDQYEPLVAEKVAELGALKGQLKDLSISELIGEKAKEMKADLGGITTSLDKLKEQLAVYTKALSSAE